ncbi:MAG: hypothetical protein ACRDVP_11285, partial [Acidimicrobiales bacterium]
MTRVGGASFKAQLRRADQLWWVLLTASVSVASIPFANLVHHRPPLKVPTPPGAFTHLRDSPKEQTSPPSPKSDAHPVASLGQAPPEATSHDDDAVAAATPTAPIEAQAGPALPQSELPLPLTYQGYLDYPD